MRADIYKEFTIEAAHSLPNVGADHKCKRLHGHSFKIELHVSGDIDSQLGWVVDFDYITEKFRPILQQLDHRYLNEIKGLENPTSENLACWIWRNLSPELPQLKQVTVKETCTAGCIYRGE